MYVTTFTPPTSTLFRSQSASNSTASILTHQPKKLPAPKIQRRYSDDNFFPIPQYSSDMPRDKAIFAFMIFSTLRLQISSMIFRPCIITPGQTAIFHQLHDETPWPRRLVLLYISTSPQVSSTEHNSVLCLLQSLH
ncbi:hypothetical protein FOYG_11447 [Fusarium oxysporum NRRL 32931]|uniref:Uncharacterized protein n=1 Tax=Fusarium oxysporum NRRL 32931 TaxID=660029 RepID=W9HXZ8_FUSOX|nr:hypothetical protein FOYG_11447 [Fusarium oxysporum NRRL 32931]